MKSAYLLAGIQFRIFFKLLRRNKVSWLPKYLFRFFFVLQNAVWASLFAWLDRRKYGQEFEAYTLEKDPVFIIGHWRTGSTFLHQLMSLDENLSAPTLFQTAQPNGFKSAYYYFRPIMKMALGKTRPFDQMKNSMDEPQEDEFALVRLIGFSPMLGLVFPKKYSFFLKEYNQFLPDTKEEMAKWEQQTRWFYKRLAWNSGKQLILKNPFHTFRIQKLLEMFPQAKFIHIYRNPMDVVPSTVRMWSIVGSQNTLNRNWKNPEIGDVSELLNSLLDTVERDKSLIPKGAYTEIRFEELEADTVGTLRKAYQSLGLEFSGAFESQLAKYMKEIQDYEKNTYTLNEAEKEEIREYLESHIIRQNYSSAMGN